MILIHLRYGTMIFYYYNEISSSSVTNLRDDDNKSSVSLEEIDSTGPPQEKSEIERAGTSKQVEILIFIGEFLLTFGDSFSSFTLAYHFVLKIYFNRTTKILQIFRPIFSCF